MMNIRARILARPDLDGLRASKDLDGLTTALNAEGMVVRSLRFVTARVIRTLPNGKDILSALKGARNLDDDIDLAYTFLMQGAGVDIGDEMAFALIDGLVAKGIFQPTWAGQLKSLAMFPVVVDRLEVAAAMFNDDGSEK